MIIEAMDLDADPCADFYQYACGSWDRKHVIPQSMAAVNNVARVVEELSVKLYSM